MLYLWYTKVSFSRRERQLFCTKVQSFIMFHRTSFVHHTSFKLNRLKHATNYRQITHQLHHTLAQNIEPFLRNMIKPFKQQRIKLSWFASLAFPSLLIITNAAFFPLISSVIHGNWSMQGLFAICPFLFCRHPPISQGNAEKWCENHFFIL